MFRLQLVGGWSIEYDIRSLLDSLRVDFDAEGSRSGKIRDTAPIDEATEDDLAFCWYVGEKGASYIRESTAGVILCKKEMQGLVHPHEKQLFIFTENPRLTFVRILNEIHGKRKLCGISPKSVISETAKIGENCYVGDYVVIGDNCTIGDNTVIYDRVSLVQNCIIGSNCVVQPGVSLGSDGFAFERYASGELEKFPHKGYTRIGNNVEICANCSVARGSLSDTVIGDGTKIDALVHIAHNVVIGRNCELTAGTIIGGSTIIGDMCWTGLNSTLKNRIKLGNNVIVASGASVIHDVPDGDIVAGVPAKSIKHKVNTGERFLMAGQTEEKEEEQKKKKTSVA
jgi:UDP-3-O-[3-hydroxymyristoyl] glucosamine N-acyltransferase LpxD